MPIYQYRREDGTTFEIRQSFSDDPLQTDPDTGQPVYRVIQASGIIFKGSGFYVTDNKGSSRVTTTNGHGEGENGTAEAKPDSKTETKAEAKTETKAESKAESKSTPKTEPATTTSTKAAD